MGQYGTKPYDQSDFSRKGTVYEKPNGKGSADGSVVHVNASKGGIVPASHNITKITHTPWGTVIMAHQRLSTQQFGSQEGV